MAFWAASRLDHCVRMYAMTQRKAELNEGPQAFSRFRSAVKTILAVPKSALQPDPFSKPKRKKKPSK